MAEIRGEKKDRYKLAIFWNGTLLPTTKEIEIGMFSNWKIETISLYKGVTAHAN